MKLRVSFLATALTVAVMAAPLHRTKRGLLVCQQLTGNPFLSPPSSTSEPKNFLITFLNAFWLMRRLQIIV
eukprot:2054527-Heterocapsa_arctica.AAC.1